MRSIKRLRSSLFALLMSVAVISSSAAAETYSVVASGLPDPGPTCLGAGQNGTAGVFRDLSTYFDVTNQRFTLDFVLERCAANGGLFNAFWAVVSSGPDPKFNAGQYAIIYFDGRNQANPIVTVYAYNGGNNASSFQDGDPSADVKAPDRILSTLAGDNFVIESAMTDLPGDRRRARIVIDTTATNINFLPQFPDPSDQWEGIAFGQYSADMTQPKLGIWLHTFLAHEIAYCTGSETQGHCALENQVAGSTTFGKSSAGYLARWNFIKHGWIDAADIPVNESPRCEIDIQNAIYNNKEDCYQVNVGQTITGSFNFSDPGQRFTVSYLSSLSGALSPASPAMFLGSGEINLNWTATNANAGQSYDILMTATDQQEASEQCGINICVNSNKPPVCDIQFDTTTPNQCDGVETRVEFTGAGSTDPESQPLAYSFTTTCADSSIELAGNGISGSLVLSAPGEGQSVAGCEVLLTVSDDIGQTTTCSLPIEVDACELDCLNQPNGTAVVDVCGVCDGDGTSCLDCAGEPNGGAQLDACNVCDGDGTSCLDCANTPFGTAEVDQCGVCGGDGTSCIECENVDISGLQFTADASVKSGERTLNQQGLRKARRALEKAGKLTKRLKKKIRETILEANALQTEAWVSIWIPNSVVSECNAEAENVCATVSNLDALNDYFDNAEALRSLAQKSLNGLVRRAFITGYLSNGVDAKTAKTRAKKRVSTVLKRVEAFIDSGIADAQQIPVETLECNL